ncbi:MAG: multicopper oxidase domain-containing protein [Deferrisomatales bacterium]
MRRKACCVLGAVASAVLIGSTALADPLPGGTLDPTTIPKYVIPLVIPPVMNNDGVPDSYDIEVREFRQQILPGGIWNTINGRNDRFKPTRVWSYGPQADPTPKVAPDPDSQFNYPAYTVETRSHVPVRVRWINGLVDEKGRYRKHLLPVDQTVHWANPPMECILGEPRTDCAGFSGELYEGPVPIVTHVHGAHVDGHSDGYPEAWWLPAAKNLPKGYATSGTLFDDATGTNPGDLGYADYVYRQDQPATTLWYHDHTLGMTRLNVYAGPAGFWLIRGGAHDVVDDTSTPDAGDGVLPGPAPQAGQSVLQLNVPGEAARDGIREIPVVIQDRSFNKNGSLFYPKFRAFFEGVRKKDLKIDFAPSSDVLPHWQPEAFFNVMVVNGVSWPELEVAPALYRLRLLNGCNSRFLWLKVDDPEVEMWQIGAEQGFFPAPVKLNDLDLDASGDGTAQVLLALAERADVLVDFRGLADGTVVHLRNIGPDEPFGGGVPGVDFEPADPGTTGQVMRFVVDGSLLGKSPTDPGGASPATDPANLALQAEGRLGGTDLVRDVSLNEGASEVVCVCADAEEELAVPIRQVDCLDDPAAACPTEFPYIVEFAPKEALLGTVDFSGGPAGVPLKWTDLSGESAPVDVTLQSGERVSIYVTENPTVGDVEEWNIYNFTEDAHPIHLHLVRFEVVGRERIGGGASIVGKDPLPWETGFKDTVIAYPGEITTVKALFDVAGLYVWHCHIVEHEDNEMMRPFVVSP